MSIITVQPGDPVYTMFGHTAIRVVDDSLDVDYSFNYGTFDYSDKLFVPKFIQGNLDYYLSVAPFGAAVRHYSIVENRSVIEQRLDLDLDDRQLVLDMLAENARPENRAYRYDFLYDNCSTRVLDILDDALPLRLPDEELTTTFRDLLNPYLLQRPSLKTGIDLSLGIEVDKKATLRQTSFLPDELMHLFNDVLIEDERGVRSLVSRTDTLTVADSKPPPFPWVALIGWLLVAVQIVAILRMRQGHDVSSVIDVFFFAVAGLSGLVIVYMWFFTRHTVTAFNVNLLWAFPGHLILAIKYARSKSPSDSLQYYAAFTVAAVLVFILLAPTSAYVSWLVVPWALLIMTNAVRILFDRSRTAHR
ncbi:MAG: DUF4105 domain-containing protein [Rhodothermales bacterium]|nr:DUF4105 domain-containing protein [Rhodothermales bacterium]